MFVVSIHSSFPLSSSPFTLFFLFFLFHIFIFFNTSYKAIALNPTTIRFDEGYSPLFSDFNIQRSPDDRTVSLLLNRQSGSGIISSDYYSYGFFSASIKLPTDHTAGIVVAFYTSNVDTFERNHDELDFEFLGNVDGRPWRFQTNMYGNGSVSRGREERYRLWFDPKEESHHYSILWSPKNIIFYVDDTPIREIIRSDSLRGDYPSKPMSVYATIWDGSTWATDGGKAKTDYRYEPFVTEMKDLVLEGCLVDPIEELPSTNCSDRNTLLLEKPYSTISPEQRQAMKTFREKYMFYSYCYDNLRYPVTPPECVIVDSERELFKESGRLREKMRLGGGRGKRHRRKGSGGQISREPRRNHPGTTAQQTASSM